MRVRLLWLSALLLAQVFFFAAYSRAETVTGSLSNPGDSYTFTINAGNDGYVEVPFTYPRGSVDFWVKLMGEDGQTLLGDFDLDNGEIIQLSGGGTFYVTIYSKSGSGRWSAVYTVEEVLVAPVKWEDVESTGISRTAAGDKVTIKGHLEGNGDSDTLYFVSDSESFALHVKRVSISGEVYAEVVEGDGEGMVGTFNLKTVKTLRPNTIGGFFVRVYSKTGSGDYELVYDRKAQRTIEFSNTITLENKNNGTATKVQLWVPIIKSFDLYQEVLDSSVSIDYKKVVTDQYGNDYYYFEFSNFGAKKTVDIEMKYTIVLKSDFVEPESCEGPSVKDFLKPERLIESDSSYIRELAAEITSGDTTQCEKAESIFRYVWSEFTYVHTDPMIGALKALKTKTGDCNEFTDAILALSRASGIPARKGNGYVFFNENRIESHAFPEVYLPGRGWTVLDSTMQCYLHRPPIYIFAYVGENPSYLREPDVEDSYLYYTWNGSNAPDIMSTQTFTARVLH